MIYNNILETIGDTPVVRLNRMGPDHVEMYVKVESFNPMGSIKDRMFEPYFSTKKGGTGLGLAIVKTIITDHNGFIRVRDNSPSGTIISIELPVKEKS